MNIFWWTFLLWAQIFDDQIECVALQPHVWDVLFYNVSLMTTYPDTALLAFLSPSSQILG